jgi:hypothetical protein
MWDSIGSSAGAGSGEFHVYRHLRRREYQRQDYMDAVAEKVSVGDEGVYVWAVHIDSLRKAFEEESVQLLVLCLRSAFYSGTESRGRVSCR